MARLVSSAQWGDPRLPQRLWDKVIPEPNSGCWLWTGQHSIGTGYGYFHWNGRTAILHRLTFTMLVGEIPPGKHIDHLCRTRLCCNPAHMEPVTPRENILRGTGGSATNARKTHCMNGHLLSQRNVYNDTLYRERGFRVCKVCKRAQKRAGAARRREARQ